MTKAKRADKAHRDASGPAPTQGTRKTRKRTGEADNQSSPPAKTRRKAVPRPPAGPQPYWAIIRTKSGRENYAKGNLTRQGFEVFYPRCLPKGRGQLEPLFRTYIFVRIIDQWLKIESTYGVQGILKRDGVPTRVPLKVIKGLKALANADGVVEFETTRKLIHGESLIIQKGAFKGHVMIYDGETAEGRVRALFSFMGSKQVIEFNRRYVAPTGATHAPAGVEAPSPTGAVASPEYSAERVAENMARQRAARFAKYDADRAAQDAAETETPPTKTN